MWQALSSSGLSVFWSDESLKQKVGGAGWLDVIQASLMSSQHFLLIGSVDSMDSYWVKQEYNAFVNLCHSKDEKNRLFVILPLLGFAIAQLPAFLQCKQMAELITDVIPVFGGEDFREILKEVEQLKNELSAERKNTAFAAIL